MSKKTLSRTSTSGGQQQQQQDEDMVMEPSGSGVSPANQRAASGKRTSSKSSGAAAGYSRKNLAAGVVSGSGGGEVGGNSPLTSSSSCSSPATTSQQQHQQRHHHVNQKTTTCQHHHHNYQQENMVQVETEVLSKLPRMDRMPVKSYRWNSNEEVAAWLYSAQEHSEWCTLDVRIRPTNGSMLLYHKKGSNYKQDGYVWKKRKDGKLPREDHMRLKVKGVEIIYANYVHSSLVPTFHRRSYWLLSYPDIVLVHYLNTPVEGELMERLLPSLRASISQHKRAELLEQLKPMLCYGPLTFDDHNSPQSTIPMTTSDEQQHQQEEDFAATGESASADDRLKWINALIDQAKQQQQSNNNNKPIIPAPQHQSQIDNNNGFPTPGPPNNLNNKGTPPPPPPPPPQTLIVTSLGQFLLAIDPQSAEGSALLARTVQQQQQKVVESSSTSASSAADSPPVAAVQQQQLEETSAELQQNPNQQQSQKSDRSGILNGIRSNSCSSASRRVMCSTIMRRQPSAFSDGADDLFRPLLLPTEVSAAASASASSSTCNMVGGFPHPHQQLHNDSAYCSFAADEPNSNPNRSGGGREWDAEEADAGNVGVGVGVGNIGVGVGNVGVGSGNVGVGSGNVGVGSGNIGGGSGNVGGGSGNVGNIGSGSGNVGVTTTGRGDPILNQHRNQHLLDEDLEDSVNLGLTQEDIATTLRANLAAMIDKPTGDLFGTLSSPTTDDNNDDDDPSTNPAELNRRDSNVVENMEEDSAEENAARGLIITDNIRADNNSDKIASGGGGGGGMFFSSQDSSFRLLNQILSGEDDGDDDYYCGEAEQAELDNSVKKLADAEKSINSSMECVPTSETGTAPGSNTRNGEDDYFVAQGRSSSIMFFEGGGAGGSGGSRAASCGSSQGSNRSATTTARRPDSRLFFASAGANQMGQDRGSGNRIAGIGGGGGGDNAMPDGHIAVATITDYSPEWSHPQGGAKVLISGPWYSTSHRYHCIFDDISVPACLVQTGVLRCYCPPHEPGKVRLMVCCDERVISNAVIFEYRDDTTAVIGTGGKRTIEITPQFWLSANESHLCMGLLEGLQSLERHLVGGSLSSQSGGGAATENSGLINGCLESGPNVVAPSILKMSDIEDRLLNVCCCLSMKDWLPTTTNNNNNSTVLQSSSPHHCGMTILHFASGLGFSRLITTLYDWCNKGWNNNTANNDNNNGGSSFLEAELQITKQDANGRTPLMWACVRGKKETAAMLASGCRDCLFIPDFNRFGELPLAAAFRDGHVDLVKQVVHQFVSENGGDPNARDLDTALWVLTSGLVERSQLQTRLFIHARRHQPQHQHQVPGCPGQSCCASSNSNARLRKQLSLDSQMIKLPSGSGYGQQQSQMDGCYHHHHQQQQQRRRSHQNGGRGCVKRASAEGLEELMRDAVDSVDLLATAGYYHNHHHQDGACRAAATSGVDAGSMTLPKKITRQDSNENTSSSDMASYVSVNEWLRRGELPLDITVPDSPDACEMWKSVGACSGEQAQQEQIASLAQQIIDALPDRIKQESFAEEEQEDMEQQDAQQHRQHHPQQQMMMNLEQYCQNDAFPSSAADLLSYRQTDRATPCSSSCWSPGLSLPGSDTYFHQGGIQQQQQPNTSGGPSYRHPQQQQCRGSSTIPLSPSTLATTSPCSSTSFLFPPTTHPHPSAAPSTTATNILDGGSTMFLQQQQQQLGPGTGAGTNEARNLGEFFNATRSRSPLECHFQELTLTDREQRQLYEAAKLIQNAYRQYKQRVLLTQTYSQVERQAAVVIQTCYRRYKRYCYFKKLHQAAVLIQKHFRLYKAAKRSKMSVDCPLSSVGGFQTNGGQQSQHQDEDDDDEEEEVVEHLDGFTQFLEKAVNQAEEMAAGRQCSTMPKTMPVSGTLGGGGAPIRIQVTQEELIRWKEHLAAVRIQHAFRGHRRRQDAAARKIQKFMREARQNYLDFTDAENAACCIVGGTGSYYRGPTAASSGSVASNSSGTTRLPSAAATAGVDVGRRRENFSAWLSVYANEQHLKLKRLVTQHGFFSNV